MAASFYSYPLIGATTTLACFAHEIPHEIRDYSILIRSGFTKKQALQSQFLTAVGAFVSALQVNVSFPHQIFAPPFPIVFYCGYMSPVAVVSCHLILSFLRLGRHVHGYCDP